MKNNKRVKVTKIIGTIPKELKKVGGHFIHTLQDYKDMFPQLNHEQTMEIYEVCSTYPAGSYQRINVLNKYL